MLKVLQSILLFKENVNYEIINTLIYQLLLLMIFVELQA
jgi:hypothetical protein